LAAADRGEFPTTMELLDDHDFSLRRDESFRSRRLIGVSRPVNISSPLA